MGASFVCLNFVRFLNFSPEFELSNFPFHFRILQAYLWRSFWTGTFGSLYSFVCLFLNFVHEQLATAFSSPPLYYPSICALKRHSLGRIVQMGVERFCLHALL